MKFGRIALLSGVIGFSTLGATCAAPQTVTVRPICVVRVFGSAIYHITAANNGQYTLELLLAGGSIPYYNQELIQSAPIGVVIPFETAILPFYVVYRADPSKPWIRVSALQELPPTQDCVRLQP